MQDAGRTLLRDRQALTYQVTLLYTAYAQDPLFRQGVFRFVYLAEGSHNWG